MTKLSLPAHHRDLPTTLSHRLHRRHEMKLAPEDGVKFKCDGCKLLGTGLRYQCSAGCDVDLHVGCALAPPRREIGGSRFKLHDKPPAPAGHRHCDACGGPARGFVYHCRELDHDVHPCCADLPGRFEVAGLSFALRMMVKRPPRRCVLCADDGESLCSSCSYWFYRCDVGDGGGAVFLHVACARDLVPNSGETTAVTSMSVGEAYSLFMASESKSVVKRSSKQPSRSGKEIVPATTTKHSTGKKIVPATTTTTKHSTGKEIVPATTTTTKHSTGKEIVPATTTKHSTGKEIVPATTTKHSTGKEIVPATTTTTTKHSTGKEIVPATTTTKHSTGKEMVPVSAKDLKALLLQGRGAAKTKSRGGRALPRSLRVLGFLVRVVIGVIFGDPTAMAMAVAGVIFPNR